MNEILNYDLEKLCKEVMKLTTYTDELENKVKVLTKRLEALIEWQGKSPTKSYREY